MSIVWRRWLSRGAIGLNLLIVVSLILIAIQRGQASFQTWTTGVPVGSVAFSPDGQMIAAGGEDGVLHLWRMTDMQPAHTITLTLPYPVSAVAFSPDGRWLAVAAGSPRQSGIKQIGWLTLWDINANAPIWSIEAHGTPITTLAFDATGEMLSTGGVDGYVRVWAARDGASLATFDIGGSQLRFHYPLALVFSGEKGRLIASDNGDTVWEWSLETQRVIRSQRSALGARTDFAPIRAQSLNPEGTLVASASYSFSPWAYTWQSSHEATSPLGERGAASALSIGCDGGSRDSLTFSPDGRHVAGGRGEDRIEPLAIDPLPWVHWPICVWATGNGAEQAKLTGHRGSVRSLAWSPDGRFLCSGSDDGTVRLWRIN